jgi:hypothetical protein
MKEIKALNSMKTISIVFFFIFNFGALAQNPPVKWKEISIEDLKMNTFEPDTSVSAIILCDYGQRYFDLNPNGRNLFLFYDRHIRIKILKPEGLKYTKFRIPYKDMICEDFPEENSITVRGMTYNLDNKGKVIATRLKQSRIKRKDSTNCYRIAEFELPNAMPGSVIDIHYKIPKLDMVWPERWDFQNELPILHSELRFSVPDEFNYMFSPRNFEHFDISESKFYQQSVHISPGAYRYYPRRPNSIFDLSGTQVRFVKTGNEKFEPQNFMHNPDDYIQSLNMHLTRAKRENMEPIWDFVTHALAITTNDDYELYEPKQRRMISYPAAYIYYTLPDWERLGQNLIKSDRFGLALIKHWAHEDILKEITRDISDPKQKMVAIYDHIRKSLDWNEKYNLFVNPVFNNALTKLYTRITKKLGNERSLRKPFENKEGTSSEINMILIYLLNKAGIETHPVILSTQNHGRVDTLIPQIKQFNHVLARATIDGNHYFLDAIDSLRPFNLVDKSHLTDQGFLIQSENFSWIEISNHTKSQLTINENLSIDLSGEIHSKIKIQETGYFALENRRLAAQDGPEALKNEYLRKFTAQGQVKNLQIKDLESDTLPLQVIAEENLVVPSVEKILIKPAIDLIFESESFNEDFRKSPVDLPFPFKIMYNLEMEIPEGYSMEVPKNQKYTAHGENISYHFLTSLSGNQLKYTLVLELKKNKYPVFEYTSLAKVYRQIRDIANEGVLIVKQ